MDEIYPVANEPDKSQLRVSEQIIELRSGTAVNLRIIRNAISDNLILALKTERSNQTSVAPTTIDCDSHSEVYLE